MKQSVTLSTTLNSLQSEQGKIIYMVTIAEDKIKTTILCNVYACVQFFVQMMT